MTRTFLEHFSYPVDSLDQLDPAVCAALAHHLRPDEPLQLIVMAPRQNRLDFHAGWKKELRGQLPWKMTPAWVLVLAMDRLLVVTLTPSADPLVTVIPIASLAWVELGAVLLKGWLDLAWVADEEMAHMRIQFNTVGDRLFRQIVHTMCGDLYGSGAVEADLREHNRAVLKHLRFKFKNIIALVVLVPGERVEAVVNQPAIWRTIYGRIRRQQAPAKVVLLTNMHLLVVEEEPSREETTNGYIARYYPLGKLLSTELQPADERLWLEIQAGAGPARDTHMLQFAPSAMDELRAVCGECERQSTVTR